MNHFVKYLSLALILWLPLISSAQFEKKNFVLSATGAQIEYDSFTPRNAYGLDLQYFVSDHVSLNYNLKFGERYVHLPAGAPVAVVALVMAVASANDGSGGLFVAGGLLAALLPEGVSFHANVNQNVVISPYINPLGFEWIKNANAGGRDTWLTGSAGTKVNFLLGDFVIAPYGEYKMLYGNYDNPGIGVGVSAGYRFH